MSYIQLDTTIVRHLKLARVSPEARWLWIQGLCYCQDLKTDGVIFEDALVGFGLPTPRPDWIAELVAKVLWETIEGGYRVHDYLEWNDPKEIRDKKRLDSRLRKRRFDERLRGGRLVGSSVIPLELPAHDLEPEPEAGVPRPLARGLLRDDANSEPRRPREVAPVDRPNGRGGSPLVMSPLKYAELEASVGYLGARFRVPKALHEELVGRYGGDEQAARDALKTWYRGLEDALGEDEAIPNIYKFINGHFERWVASRSAVIPAPVAASGSSSPVTPEFKRQMEDKGRRDADAKKARQTS